MADDETIDEPDQPLQLQFYSFCPQHQVVANLLEVETRSGQIAGGVLITLDSDSPPFYVLTFTSREPEFTVRFVFIDDRHRSSDLRLWYGVKGVKAEFGWAALNLLRKRGFAGVPLVS